MPGHWVDEHADENEITGITPYGVVGPPDQLATSGYASYPPSEIIEPEGTEPGEPSSDPLQFTVAATFDTRYARLRAVLDAAFKQASEGKGEERHGDAEPFERQLSCQINRTERGYARGQALKKIKEAKRLDPGGAIFELRGAIISLAIEIITLEDETHEAG